MHKLLDNIFWNTLTGQHARFAQGTGNARRYAKGFSPIVGFADAMRPDFDALRPFCETGEQFYCSIWSGSAPTDWRVEAESTMCCMVREPGPVADDEAPDAVQLGPQHASLALELATLTRPGPFGPRTIELGEYFGYFEGARLVAMAGERTHAGSLHEISGVCTHPDHQGRGLARRLMSKLIARQAARAETSFLHVMSANRGAHRLYEQLGFRDYLVPVVRVISPV